MIVAVAFRNVVRHRRRSVVVLLAVTCGIAALIVAGGFISWNLRFGREATIHSQLGHVRIVRHGYLEGGTADPFSYLIPESAAREAAILATPHVTTLAPRLEFNGLISHAGSTLSFLGEGVAPDRERDLSRSLTIVAGKPLSAHDPLGIIVGRGLADNLGVAPGMSVVLMANTGRGAINAVEVHVLGTFATITKAYDDAALRIPIETARKLLRVSGAHSYTLLLDKTSNTDRVVRELRSRLSGQGLEIVPWYRLADFYNKTAALFARQVQVIRVIIAVIIALCISNSVMMSVMERTREIGTAMAIGVRSRVILLQFLVEGLMLGSIGGVGGLVLGGLIATLASAIGIPMPAAPGMASGFVAGVDMTWANAISAFAIALVTATAAAIYPAWRASRTNIVDALRHGY